MAEVSVSREAQRAWGEGVVEEVSDESWFLLVLEREKKKKDEVRGCFGGYVLTRLSGL